MHYHQSSATRRQLSDSEMLDSDRWTSVATLKSTCRRTGSQCSWQHWRSVVWMSSTSNQTWRACVKQVVVSSGLSLSDVKAQQQVEYWLFDVFPCRSVCDGIRRSVKLMTAVHWQATLMSLHPSWLPMMLASLLTFSSWLSLTVPDCVPRRHFQDFCLHSPDLTQRYV